MALGKSYSKLIRILMYTFLLSIFITAILASLGIKVGYMFFRVSLLMFVLIPLIGVLYLAVRKLLIRDFETLVPLIIVSLVILANILLNISYIQELFQCLAK